MPLVARDLLHGGPQTYGIMLGAFGAGAVIGALNLNKIRRRLSAEAAVRVCLSMMGGGIALVALNLGPVPTAAALIVAGAGWTMVWSLFNVAVQLSAPRWVSGRALAAYQAASNGGIALGSWGWGHVTDSVGIQAALLAAAALLVASSLLGLWLRIPQVGARGEETVVLDDPKVRLALTGRSGPVIVEIEYRVSEQDARAFHGLMLEVQAARKRNGAYGWSIARDVSDPELWSERYHCPTWYDYLRHRNRSTVAEAALGQRAVAFHMGPDPVRIHRMLERPFGSVRAHDDPGERSSVMPVAKAPGGSST
jgi:MFS family permease